MKPDKTDGGPAFPTIHQATPSENPWTEGGLSLRDYFAAQALIGILAMNAGVTADAVASTEPSRLAANAYLLADAMLAERAK